MQDFACVIFCLVNIDQSEFLFGGAEQKGVGNHLDFRVIDEVCHGSESVTELGFAVARLTFESGTEESSVALAISDWKFL